MEEKEPICIKEVNENIIRVRQGLPLTRSLSELNFHCEFRKEWEARFNMVHDIDDTKKKMKD